MDAELVKELDDKGNVAVEALVALCNAHDHTNYDTELDGDFYYLVWNDDPEESGVDEALFAVLSGYLLGETIDGQPVLEIEAFTHPAMRQIGMFRLCYQSLLDDFRGYRIRFMIKRPTEDNASVEGMDTLGKEGEGTAAFASSGTAFISETPSLRTATPFVLPDTYETLRALGATHQYDELFLQKTLARAIADPGDSLCNRYGEVHLTPFSADTLYLHGLLVYDKYLRQGHGRALMEAVESPPADGPYQQILLQVSSTNAIALHLYLSLGYQETDRVLYFLNAAPHEG